MSYPQYRGQIDKTRNTGDISYVGDGTNFYPVLASTAGVTTSGKPIIAQREPFIFRPGRSALASTSLTTGMVLSGTRNGSPTVASTSANVTVYGTEVVYEPARAGKIDGIAASGVVSGQITIGSICAVAQTCLAKHTMRIRNKGGTWTTCLNVSGTVAVGGTTEVYTTYDVPHLLTTADFNAVPFGVAIGVQSNEAGTAAVARIMESSYISGEFEPST